MNEERQEPTITHEYRAAFARQMNQESGQAELVVTMTTVRELVSLGYTINVQTKRTKQATTIQIGGLSVARHTLSRAGGAVGTVAVPWPGEGTHHVVFERKGKRCDVELQIRDTSLKVESSTGDAFVEVVDSLA